MVLDLDFVRAQFPAFSEPALEGQAFFENAGGSYVCGQVLQRLTRFYRSHKVQPYAPYPAAQLAGAAMDAARRRLAAMLGVGEDELHIGPSTTQNVYVLAQAVRRWLPEGAAIVVTEQDHEANSGPWRRLAEEGVELREWRVDPASGRLDPADLAPLLADGRVRLVAFPHCSNIVGEFNPLPEILAMVHEAGAVACVDGVSAAPHGLPDLAALEADIYLFSAYKTWGPHQGVMVIRRALADQLPAQGHGFNAHDPVKRFTPAGPDHAQVAALAGIADYIDALHAHHFGEAEDVPPRERSQAVAALMRRHEIALMRPLLAFLAERPGLRLIGPAEAERRAPTLSLALDEPGEAAAARLARHGIMAGGGDFYAPRVLRAMGIDPARGVLRLSFLHYTRPDEVARLIEALDAELPRR